MANQENSSAATNPQENQQAVPITMLEAAARAMIQHPFDGNYQLLAQVSLEAAGVCELLQALEPFAQRHYMGDHYVQFAPRLIEAARAAVAKAKGGTR